ncbi:MAG: hypothetical protein ACFHWX_05035 [Bacteroidota bacterium]
MMKPISRFGSFVVVFLALAVFISCGKDEEPCTESTWYQDADGDGLGNADVSQDACEAPEGFVADNTDSDDSCATGDIMTFYRDADGDGLGDPEITEEACEAPTGFVANSDDVGDCFATCQDVGADSELGIFFDGFQSRTDADGNLLWEPVAVGDAIEPGIVDNVQGNLDENATLNGGADYGVDGPLEGDFYLSLISPADDANRSQNRFAIQPCQLTGDCGTEGGATVDLSSYTDPYLNIWINSGTGESDSAAIGELQFRLYDAVDQQNLTWYNWDPNNEGSGAVDLKVKTGGEWRVYSFQLYSDVYEVNDVYNQNLNTSTGLIERIRFSMDTRSIISATTNFVLNIDAISITEGPLVDVRYPEGYPE